MAEVVVRPRLVTLEAVITEIDRLWDKVSELQDIARDLTDRMTDFEHFLASIALPTPTPTLLRAELERLIPPEIYGSRWVLEIFPDEVEEWRRAIRTIPTEKLSERERSFLRALDYYIVSERKITIPQLAWLSAIQRKAGGVVPTVPMPAASSSEHHSNPERIAYWEVVYRSPEEPEKWYRRPITKNRKRAEVWRRMLEERGYEVRVMPVYAKSSSNPKKCRICFYPLPEGAEKCPRCLAPVKKE